MEILLFRYGEGVKTPIPRYDRRPSSGSGQLKKIKRINRTCPQCLKRGPEAGSLVNAEQFSDVHGSGANTLFMPVSAKNFRHWTRMSDVKERENQIS